VAAHEYALLHTGASITGKNSGNGVLSTFTAVHPMLWAQKEAVVTTVTAPGDVLLASHKELEQRTKSGLAQATARAAEAAAKSSKPIDVSSTAHLRDLAQSAARLFGWSEGKDKGPRDIYNTLVVTQEQLEQIRQLRATED
jgi:hypothetical protein